MPPGGCFFLGFTTHHPIASSAHLQPAAPGRRGREAQPTTEPSQETEGRRGSGGEARALGNWAGGGTQAGWKEGHGRGPGRGGVYRTVAKPPCASLWLQGTLTFSKELPKSLAGGLLPSPLAVAAVMAAAAGSPLSLRPAPAAPLLQGPPITHPLLHPAPGPIRTAHGPILFSPY